VGNDWELVGWLVGEGLGMIRTVVGIASGPFVKCVRNDWELNWNCARKFERCLGDIGEMVGIVGDDWDMLGIVWKCVGHYGTWLGIDWGMISSRWELLGK
jgi:hypothetical protein